MAERNGQWVPNTAPTQDRPSERAVALAEDDFERSRYIRRRAHSGLALSGGDRDTPGTLGIPRVLVQYWNSARHIPDDVRRCLNSWDALRDRGLSRLLFDDESARDFLRDNLEGNHVAAFDRCPHPAMRCDLFRLCYLVTKGGVYIDADEVCLGTGLDHLIEDDRLKLQPLCYDSAARSMVRWSDALSAHEPPSSWIYYVNNNPLIAPPNHPVLKLALTRATCKVLGHEPRHTLDIQSMTGPGNLTASLVAYSISSGNAAGGHVVLLNDWDRISHTEWDLDYRRDSRNWRTWVRMAPERRVLQALLDA